MKRNESKSRLQKLLNLILYKVLGLKPWYRQQMKQVGKHAESRMYILVKTVIQTILIGNTQYAMAA